MSHHSRSAFLGAASGFALAAALGPRSARAADSVHFGTIPIDPAAECYYGQDMGFFEKAGIHVDIDAFNSGGAIAAALAGGSIDIGNVDLVSLASGHARGLPFVQLAPTSVFSRGAETYFVLVKQSSSIKVPKDLSGKTIAVNGLKNINQIPTQAWIDNNGGDSRTTKFIEMPFPAMVPALEDEKLDAICVAEPTLAITNGKYRSLPIADKNLAPQFQVAGWVTTKDWVAKNPDLAKRLGAALLETAKWANANHEKSAEILAKNTKLPLETILRMHRSYYGERQDAALIQPVIDATAKYGVIEKSFPAADIMVR